MGMQAEDYMEFPFPHAGSNLFPAWHRPYVLLLETSITGLAKQIATRYPRRLRDAYISAANEVSSDLINHLITNQHIILLLAPAAAPMALLGLGTLEVHS